MIIRTAIQRIPLWWVITVLLIVLLSADARMVYAQNDSVATRGATTGASIKIFAGGGTFQFSDGRGNADRPLQVFYYRPDGWTINSSIVFIMHGVNRDAARYCNDWTYLAKKYNFLLVCPRLTRLII